MRILKNLETIKAGALMVLLNLYHCTYGALSKKLLARKMKRKHESLLVEVRKKERLKVIFLVVCPNMWKLDLVFTKMLDDPYFDPLILVCPIFKLEIKENAKRMELAYQFFAEKNYPVIKANRAPNHKWLELDELKPDLLFFTSPHKVTIDKYYKNAYTKYLSCFAGYGFIAREYRYYDPNLDKWFHQALWRNYATDEYALKRFKNNSILKGRNTLLTGAAYVEDLLFCKKDIKTAWGNTDNRKRIIFAPHYTIEEKQGFKLSNFLMIADKMIEIREQYKNSVYWSFRPHPLLKDALYGHEEWGKERTDQYYSSWEQSEHSELSTGNYIGLFQHSDAMIHDSGSFMVEYLTQKKPVLYLTNPKTTNVFNEMYRRAHHACKHGWTVEDIYKFVDSIVGETAKISQEHIDFYNKEFVDLYSEKSPSWQIINDIKSKVKKWN